MQWCRLELDSKINRQSLGSCTYVLPVAHANHTQKHYLYKFRTMFQVYAIETEILV